MIGDASALQDSLNLVEAPVDTEVNAALAVFFLGLRQRCEGARNQRPDIALIVGRDTIQFVGDEGERNVIGAEVISQRLEQRTAESRVAGGVGREGWREIRAGQVAR